MKSSSGVQPISFLLSLPCNKKQKSKTTFRSSLNSHFFCRIYIEHAVLGKGNIGVVSVTPPVKRGNKGEEKSASLSLKWCITEKLQCTLVYIVQFYTWLKNSEHSLSKAFLKNWRENIYFLWLLDILQYYF